MQIKPKKVYLNYNLIKREFQTERTMSRTRVNSSLEQVSNKIQMTSQSVDSIQPQCETKPYIKEYCYLFYVDESGLNDRLQFKLKPIIEACTKNCIPNLLNQETYKLFLPYSSNFQFNQINSFERLTSVQAVVAHFYKLKSDQDEYLIQRMFDYFFVPPRELATQMLNDLKYQLGKTINKRVKVMSFFDGNEITNICQLGWNPPTLLCSDSKETLSKQLPKIYENVRVSKRLKIIRQFKDQIMQQCGQISSVPKEQIKQNIKIIKRIQQQIENQKEFDIQLPKLVVQNVQPKFRLIKPIPEKEETVLEHLSLEMIHLIRGTNPKLDTYDIYQYYIDFKSLCMLSPKSVVEFKYISNELNNEEQIRVYRAIGAQVHSLHFKWKEYLLLRLLSDSKGNPEQVVQFLINYFLNDNLELTEASVMQQLNRVAQLHALDTFALTIFRWMQKNGFFLNGQLNKEAMMQQYCKNEYTFLFVINCILGKFKTNVLEWFYNIY